LAQYALTEAGIGHSRRFEGGRYTLFTVVEAVISDRQLRTPIRDLDISNPTRAILDSAAAPPDTIGGPLELIRV